MSEEKTCKQCQAKFVVTSDDLAFYKKISPTFAGRTFEVPAPTLCPGCRRQRRLVWRNNSALYRRKCDATGQDIISPFAPNSKHKVYHSSFWWSDKFDAAEFARDYDASKPFFEQLQELHLAVPVPHTYNANDNENSDYANCSSGAKSCYLVQSSTDSEDCFYSKFISRAKDCIDCLRVFYSERCYECVNVDSSYECFYCTNSASCAESMFLDHCRGVKNSFACSNLRDKQYWVYNKPSTKEEYEKTRAEFLALKGREREEKIKEIGAFLAKSPKRFSYIIKSEDCSGDQIYLSKNAKNCFYVGNSENVKHCFNLEFAKDSADHDFWGEQTGNIYEAAEVGNQASDVFFTRHCSGNCRGIYYSVGVYNGSSDCFGCVGLKHKQYCILNKQYSRQEYEELVARIIAQMQESGEWGEFFPIKMAAFAYNESLAQDFFPLDEGGAEAIGGRWQSEDFAPEYEGASYQPEDISRYRAKVNPHAQESISDALSGVLKCDATGKPFKLQSRELVFYIENGIQVPTKHPDQRHEERSKLTNPPTLHHRRCMCEEGDHGHEGRCSATFETTYAPDRPEKVYCKECYQKSVI